MASSSSSSTSSYGSSLSWFSISNFLSQISEEQIPDPEETIKFHQIGMRIVSVLERELQQSTPNAQVLIAGSYGKGTAISNGSDYDIVIFFTDMEPPFTQLLGDMERAITKNSTSFKNL